MPERRKQLMVMVVDDDHGVTQAIVQALSGLEQEFGFQTIPCFDGQDALDTFERLLPEIVILDLMLPKRGGFPALTKEQVGRVRAWSDQGAK